MKESQSMLVVQEIEVSKLKPWENNPRLNDQAVEAVAKSIRAFGFNAPILCDQNFTIVAGHTRWKAAANLGMATVPVIVLQMTESQRRAFAVADNKTAEIADWDFPKLQEVLKELQSEEIELASLGYSDAELCALLEKEQDFDWEAFDTERTEQVSTEYTLFPVKVPRRAKMQIQCAVRERARVQELSEKDSAVTAGRVLASLLGISNEHATSEQGRGNDPMAP